MLTGDGADRRLRRSRACSACACSGARSRSASPRRCVASVGIGLALLLAFHEQDWSLLGDTLGAEALSGGSVGAAMLAALAVGGWVFIGFDACASAAEETKDAARHVPRAIWIALLSVGALVILNAVAAGLAHPDPAAVVAGQDLDPVTTAVVSSFGTGRRGRSRRSCWSRSSPAAWRRRR